MAALYTDSAKHWGTKKPDRKAMTWLDTEVLIALDFSPGVLNEVQLLVLLIGF